MPEGLDMDAAFNPTALSKLLALEMPENLTLATLTFAISVSAPHMEHHMDSEEEKISRLSSAFAFPSDDLTKGTTAYPSINGDYNNSTNTKGSVPYTETGGVPTNHPGRSAEDNLFYLGGGPSTRAADFPPLSQSLAEAFEPKKEKKVKGAKKEKRKKDDFNMRDMLPAGAISSDDERGPGRKEKKSGSRKKEVC